MTTPPQNRLQWVDAARGVAALSVTVYHFQIGAGLAHVTHLSLLNWVSWPGSRLAVPLFFVISGFSIHYAERAKMREWPLRPGAFGSYMLRRSMRIYPPYLAALALALSIEYLLRQPVSRWDLVAHLLMVHQYFPTYFNSINVVFWSIGVEMWLYLLYPFALRTLEKRGLRFTGAAVFLVSASSIALTSIVSPSSNVVGLWFVLNLFFGWCMGAAVAEGFVRGHFFFRSAQWWITGVVLLALHLGLYMAHAFAGALWPAFIPSVVVLTAWLLTLVLNLEQSNLAASAGAQPVVGLLRWLGTISYSLYLVHEPLINIRSTVLDHLSGHVVRQAAFCPWYGVPFAVAWLCWWMIERPSMRLSKRLKATLA